MHDLRTPLTTIRGFAEFGLTTVRASGPPVLVGTYERILRASIDMEEMLESVLGIGAGDTQKVVDVSLDLLIRDLARALPMFIKKRARLDLQLAGSLPHVRAVTVELSRMVSNLVRNAVEAIREKGESHYGCISIATAVTDDGRVQLTVSDDGCGMDDGTRARALAGSFSSKSGGYGIGMKYVLRVVQRCSGSIDVHSAPGIGTSFIIRLPPAP